MQEEKYRDEFAQNNENKYLDQIAVSQNSDENVYMDGGEAEPTLSQLAAYEKEEMDSGTYLFSDESSFYSDNSNDRRLDI